jgi:hypothetical protein
MFVMVAASTSLSSRVRNKTMELCPVPHPTMLANQRIRPHESRGRGAVFFTAALEIGRSKKQSVIEPVHFSDAWLGWCFGHTKSPMPLTVWTQNSKMA